MGETGFDVDHPSAWKSSDFPSTDDLAFDLSGRDISILEASIAPWRGREETDLDLTGRDAFPPGELGEGIVNLAGTLMYRAFCCQMGRLLCQGRRRERIGLVAHRPERVLRLRGCERAGRQMLHTDMESILGMLCVRKARDGGESRLANALTIHNEISASRPELPEPLQTGFPVTWGEEPPGRPTDGYTDYDVSVVSRNEDRLSVC